MMTPYYSHKDITIYHGDCREILPNLPKVDLVLTDPPYIVGANGCGLAGDRAYLHDITQANLDRGFDSLLLEQHDNWFCFCGKQQLYDVVGRALCGNWMLITWCKKNPTPLTNNNYLPDTEYIVHKYSKGRLFGEYKDKSRFYVSNTGKSPYDHPTVKPTSLIIKLLRLGTQERDTVLDPFMGSGTTLVAAKQLGRKAIGIEIEEKYCEIAVNRLAQEVLNF
jgi:site-specific DNA-methyltransferase (adenine-specific)